MVMVFVQVRMHGICPDVDACALCSGCMLHEPYPNNFDTGNADVAVQVGAAAQVLVLAVLQPWMSTFWFYSNQQPGKSHPMHMVAESG